MIIHLLLLVSFYSYPALLPGRVGHNGNRRTMGVERLRMAHDEIRQSGNPGCPLGYMYNDFYSFVAHPDRPARFVSYAPRGPDARPAGRMHELARHKRLEFDGPVYTVYLLDAVSVAEQEKYLQQVAVQVSPRKGG